MKQNNTSNQSHNLQPIRLAQSNPENNNRSNNNNVKNVKRRCNTNLSKAMRSRDFDNSTPLAKLLDKVPQFLRIVDASAVRLAFDDALQYR